MHQNAGSPKRFETEQGSESGIVPASLLPGVAVKGVFALKKNFDLWRSEATKLRCCYHNVVQRQFSEIADLEVPLGLPGTPFKCSEIQISLTGRTFASVSFMAQHGSFQKLFFDLTRFQARLDFPSGTKLLSDSLQLAQDFLNSQTPSLESVPSDCPNTTVSLQQQIGGPFSFRVDSRIQVDLKDRAMPVRVDDPVFAIEYALQVLGSTKAIAWYSPKNGEFKVELRLFEK